MEKNLFLLPTGKAAKHFIEEITCVLNSSLDYSAITYIVFNSIRIVTNLK